MGCISPPPPESESSSSFVSLKIKTKYIAKAMSEITLLVRFKES